MPITTPFLLKLGKTFFALSAYLEVWEWARTHEAKAVAAAHKSRLQLRQVELTHEMNEVERNPMQALEKKKKLDQLNRQERELILKDEIIRRAYRDMGYQGDIMIDFYSKKNKRRVYSNISIIRGAYFYCPIEDEWSKITDQQLYAVAAVAAARELNWHYQFMARVMASSIFVVQPFKNKFLIFVLNLCLIYYLEQRTQINSVKKLHTGKDLADYYNQVHQSFMNQVNNCSIELNKTPAFFASKEYQQIQARREEMSRFSF